MHDILEGDDFDAMLSNCHTECAGLYDSAVTDQAKPSMSVLKANTEDLDEDVVDEEDQVPPFESV